MSEAAEVPVTEAPQTGGESLNRGDLGNNPEPESTFEVPEAYREKGWAKNIKSQDDLLKQFDNLQGLIGKKTVPSQDAPDEEWNEFFSKLRPESPDKYQLEYPEGIEIDTEQPEVKEELEFVRGMMHEAGLSQRQADMLFKKYVGFAAGKQPTPEQIAENEAKQNQEFDAKMKETFGDKASDALKASSRAMAALSEEERKALNALPNEQLIPIVKLLSEAQKSKGEDKMPNGEPTGNGGQTIEQARKELAETRTSQAYRDFTHPDHAEAKKKVEELSERVRKHYS